MVEPCHKCGTELGDEQTRYRTYRVETPEGDREALMGRLCSDCVVDFEDWLNRDRLVNQ